MILINQLYGHTEATSEMVCRIESISRLDISVTIFDTDFIMKTSYPISKINNLIRSNELYLIGRCKGDNNA